MNVYPSSNALWILALLTHSACRSQSTEGPPPADRSDGRIPEVRAPHVDRGVIHVDGKMDEAAWRNAGSTGAFVNPGDGHSAPDSHVNADARFVWDDDQLYVGFVVRDGDPSSPFGPNDVDPHIWERSSAVEIMLQPGDPGNNTRYYEIQVDTAGAVWDTQFDDYNRPITDAPSGRLFGHQDWTSHLHQASVIDRSARIYTLEIAVPWASLTNPRTSTPPNPGDAWRVNLYSFRDGQRDALAWSPILSQGNFHRSTRFGRVTWVR